MRTTANKIIIQTTILLSLFFFGSAQSQILNEDCVVNILNRTINVSPDGGWSMPNVPSNMGRIRARATCVRDGVTISGQSDYFTIVRNGITPVSDIVFDNIDQIPSAIDVKPTGASTLDKVNATLQLTAVATFPDGSTADVTAADSGVNYTSTNPAIVTVSNDGLVTAKTSGSVLISVRKDGAIAVKKIIVSIAGDADNDGLPDDYEQANGLNPNDPIDAQEDIDNDGLTALEEFQNSTDLNKADTDGDGIKDGEELITGNNGYITNPTLFDTDGDGLNDGVEIMVNSDPNDKNDAKIADALDSLFATPSNVLIVFNSVNNEASDKIVVSGLLIDGSTIDLTSKTTGTTYTSSDLSIVSFGSEDGKLFGGAVGKATVTVSNNGKSVVVPVEVQQFTAVALSAISIPGYANNVDVLGSYAYVASGASGLTVIDVSDPESPVNVAQLDTTGVSIDVKVVGNTLYLADGSSGLQIIDISDPLSPQLIATQDTAGIAQDVVVDFQVAYLATGINGVEIIDVKDPAEPISLATLGGLGEVKGLDVEGTTLVAVSANAFHVIDISDPAAPVLLGSINMNQGKDVVLSQGYAYVAAYSSGYKVIDVRTPGSPTEVYSDRSFVPRDVVLTNGLAFFAEQLFPNVTAFINTQDPTNAVFQGTIDLSGLGDYAGTGIALDSRYVYITEESYVVSSDFKETGDTKLFIAQYRQVQDNRGVAPDIQMTSPKAGDVLVENGVYVVSADATDDVAVTKVSFYLNGTEVFVDTTSPYQFTLKVPTGASMLSLSAEAVDFGGNIASSGDRILTIEPDDDKDGLGNNQEINVYLTDPNKADTDDDGLIDGKELDYRTDPLNSDSDGDGRLDGAEVAAGTDPNNPDITPPGVASVNPQDAATDVPESSLLEVTFNELISRKTVTANAMVVTEVDTGITVDGSVKLSTDRRKIIFTPKNLLKDYTNYRITVDGVRDVAGNPMAATFNSTFVTGNVIDQEPPRVKNVNPNDFAQNVPVNVSIAIEFDEPVDINSIDENTFYIWNGSAKVDGVTVLSEDRTRLYFTPNAPLAVKHTYTIYYWGLTDLFGNKIYRSSNFITAFIADADAPQVIGFSIEEGYTSVPTNAVLQVRFSEPVNALKLNNISLLKNSVIVPLSARTLSDDRQTVTLETASILDADTAYQIIVDRVEDLSGNVLASAVTRSFTTGNATDAQRPAWQVFSPFDRAEIFSNQPVIEVQYNERLNPLSLVVNNASLSDSTVGIDIPIDVQLAADGARVQITPLKPLKSDHRYYMSMGYGIKDIAGNSANYPSWYFDVKSDQVDTTAPVIDLQSIVDGDTNIAINAQISVSFSEAVSPLCLNDNSISLSSGSTSVAGAYQISSDYRTITFSPASQLASDTSYTFQLDGLCDLSGNLIATSSLAFTTSSSATADGTRPKVTMLSPAPNSTGVRGDSNIILSFDEPIDVTTLSGISVTYGNNSAQRIAGSLSVNSARDEVTFTPLTAFPANSRIYVSVSGVKDLAGNQNSYFNYVYFDTSAEIIDSDAPTVVSITPTDNAIDIDPATSVTLTFSESLDSATLSKDNFAIFANGERLYTSIIRSADNRSVTLSATLPKASVISVVATSNIKDFSGNSLKDFVSLFTTSAGSDTERPRIIAQRPESTSYNVATDKNLVLYASEPLDEASLVNAFFVSQDGRLVNGSLSLKGDGRVLLFEPSQPWSNGSLVEVFVESLATDINGNAIQAYQRSFRIVPDDASSPLGLEALMPRYGKQNVVRNAVMDMKFSEPLDTALTTAGVRVYPSGMEISASLEFLQGNRVLRIKPAQLLSADTQFQTWVNARSVDGDLYNTTFVHYFKTGSGVDNNAPGLTQVSPPDGATLVSINAGIDLVYDEAINPLSIPDDGGIAGISSSSMSFSSDNQRVIYKLHDPLPENQTVTLALPLVEDQASNVFAAQSVTFNTSSEVDFDSPSIAHSSPYANENNVPVNPVIKVEFNEPLDPGSVTVDTFYVEGGPSAQRVAGSLSLGANGKVVTFVPDSALSVHSQYWISIREVLDLAGNSIYDAIYFITTHDPDITPPQVSGFNIDEGLTDIPINAVLKVRFTEPVSNVNSNTVTLFASGVQVNIADWVFSEDHQTVTLKLNNLLQTQTDYLIRVEGVEDLSGNVLTGSVGGVAEERNFTTGIGVDLSRPNWLVYTPFNEAEVFSTTPEISIRYDERIDSLSITPITLRFRDVSNNWFDIPYNFNISSDGMTLSIAPLVALQQGHTYQVDAYSSIKDLAANQINPRTWRFTVESDASDLVAPSTNLWSIDDGAVDVAVNAKYRVTFNEAISELCVNGNTVTLGDGAGNVSGTVSVTDDNTTVEFIPNDVLANSTTYTLSLDGICDLSGNVLPVTSYSFTTAVSTATDNSRPIVSMTPAPDNTGVSGNTSIVISFNEVIDPTTVSGIRVTRGSDSGQLISGNLVVNAARTEVTFTPDSAFPPNTRIYVKVIGVQDLAGNENQSFYRYFETSADVLDTIAPTVTSVTPADGAIDIAFLRQVVINFSESLDANTIDRQHFAVYANGEKLNINVSRSFDNRAVILTGTFPDASLISVVMTNGVKDHSGNEASDFISLFTTADSQDASRPYIIRQYPASGGYNVSPDKDIVLYSSEPLNAASLSSAFHVSQNGQLVSGTMSLSGNDQVIHFVPDQPWNNDAIVSIFVDGTVTDVAGNPINSYTGSFLVAKDSAANQITISNISPVYNQKDVPLNAVLDVMFDEPLDAASITAGLRLASDSSSIAVSTSLMQNNRVLRISPVSPLAANTQYYTSVSVSSADGDTFSSSYIHYFETGTTEDTVTPQVVSISPSDGLSAVGINAQVSIKYDEAINPVSLPLDGGISVITPHSVNISSDNRQITYVLHEPLPASQAITINAPAIEDLAANAVAPASSTFNTAASLDTTSPTIIQFNPFNGAVGVSPGNEVVVKFDEPVLPNFITNDSFYVYSTSAAGKVAGSTALSADGTTLTFVPNDPWGANESYYVSVSLIDLAGNYVNHNSTFAASANIDTVPPQVIGFSVVEGLTNVPTNSVLNIKFDEPIDGLSVSGIKLYIGSVEVSLADRRLSSDHRMVTLKLNKLLEANTSYSIQVDGVRDISGNVMSTSVVRNFTTGNGVDLVRPEISSFTPFSNAEVASTQPLISIKYNERINPLSLDGNVDLYNQTTSSYVTGINFSTSTEGTIASIFPDAPLLLNNNYRAKFDGNISDLSGNKVYTKYVYFKVITDVSDVDAPIINNLGIADGATDVSLNSRVRVVFNESVSPVCVDNNTVSLSNTSGNVSGDVSFDTSTSPEYKIVMFKPSTDLDPNTTYTFTLNGVCDLSGNQLAYNQSSFETGVTIDGTQPTVTSMTPVDGSTGNVANTTITLTFDEVVDPTYFGAIDIKADGVKVPGSLTMNTARTEVVFTPDSDFAAGANVKVYVRMRDTAGNENNYFYKSFSIAP